MVELTNNSKKPLLTWVISTVAITYALFHLYTATFGPFPELIQRSIHVSGALILFYLGLLQVKEKGLISKSFNIVLLVMAISSSLYIMFKFNEVMKPMYTVTSIDIFFAITTMIVVIESTRRLIGLFIPILAALMIIYAYFGDWFPGIWHHNGVSLSYMTEVVFLSTRGIYGVVTGISVSVISIFVIFGALLFATGAGKTFMDLASWLTGASKGGAAKIAAVGSGLFGMMNGSAAANVATTGAFTIPLMKKLGYKPEFAAGVESSASSGGQIMPPIMGAGAFIMAELLGLPYSAVMFAAIIPAVLFYLGVIMAIDFESKKMNYKGVPRSSVPKISETLRLKNSLPVFLPIFTLLYFFMSGYTASGSAIRAIIVLLLLYFLMDIKNFKTRFFDIVKGLIQSSKDMISIVALIAAAQIILSMITLTGIGIKFSSIIIALGESNLLLAGLFAMVAAIIIGMGLPTVGAYMLAASVLAPALIRLGVEPISAHFFLFYFAIFAGITPPVAGTVFIGATIAKANWLKSSWVAIRVSIAAFIVPFILLYSPAMLLVGTTGEIILVTITSIIGVIMVAAGAMGYYLTNTNIIERIVLLGGGLILIIPGIMSDVIGVLAITAITIYQLMKKRKLNSVQETQVEQVSR